MVGIVLPRINSDLGNELGSEMVPAATGTVASIKDTKEAKRRARLTRCRDFNKLVSWFMPKKSKNTGDKQTGSSLKGLDSPVNISPTSATGSIRFDLTNTSQASSGKATTLDSDTSTKYITTVPSSVSIGTPNIERSLSHFRSGSFRTWSRASQIQLLDVSWEDWLEKYQRAGSNLSEISRPTCFNGFGHMAAPLYRCESARLRAVDKLSHREIWKGQNDWLQMELRKILTKYRLKSATVSLLQRTTQHIMCEVGLGHELEIIGRELSIDAHTILSSDYFSLLDASSDWRTRLNPMVHGPPFVKFYLGIPLVIDTVPIGCIAILDPYIKTRVVPSLVDELKSLSSELVSRLEVIVQSKQRTWRQRTINWMPHSQDFSSSAAVASTDDEHNENDDHRMDPVEDVLHAIHMNDEMESVAGAPSVENNNGKRQEHSDDSSSCASSKRSNSTAAASSIGNRSQESILVPVANQYARLQPLKYGRPLLQPFEVFESLLKCETIHQAIKKACRIIMQNVGADVVYLAEVRTVQKMHRIIDPHGRLNGCSVDHIVQTRNVEMKPISQPEPCARLVGNCRPNITVNVEDLVQHDLSLLDAAFSSRYGVKFAADPKETNSELPSGVLLPLRRSVAKYRSAGNHGEILTGGFVMGAFVTKYHEFSPGDCVFMKKVVRALENILTCYDEVQQL